MQKYGKNFKLKIYIFFKINEMKRNGFKYYVYDKTEFFKSFFETAISGCSLIKIAEFPISICSSVFNDRNWKLLRLNLDSYI